MNFYQAWDQMRAGHRVTMPGREWEIGLIQGADIDDGHRFVQYGPGYMHGWTPYAAELLSESWTVVTPDRSD